MNSEGASIVIDERDRRGGPVPKLRFSAFDNADSWNVRLLKDICRPQQWTTISSSDLVEEGYPVYGANGFIGYYTNFNHEYETVAVTCRGSTCGEVTLIPPESYITGNSMCLDGIDPKENSYHFIYQMLKYRGFKDIISGSAQPQIVGSAIKYLKIVLPKHAEQQKIANFLSSIDSLIVAEADKLDALKDHKTGLMRQFFPAPGENTPRLRFPEFQDAGDWEDKQVGDVFTVTRGNVLSMTLVEDVRTDRKPYPVYSSQTKRAGLAGYYSDFLYEDAITWTTDGANAGDVNYRPGKFYCTNVCGVLFSRTGHANPCVAAIINSVSKSHVSYVGNPKLMNGVMAKIVVPLPSVEEQAKISLCLSSADTLISAQKDKISILKAHKRGLMQQLFPVADEVQG
jgi:type I restriction enzyme, S subunit